MNPLAGFWLAIGTGFAWSVGNVIDKLSVSTYIRSPIFLLFVTHLLSLALGIVFVITVPMTFTAADWWWVVAMGTLYLGGIALYFTALQYDEPSRLAPLFSLSIVFLAVLGALLLGEVFQVERYVGIAVIVLGSYMILLRGSWRDPFRSRGAGLIALSCLLYSFSYVIMKMLLGRYTAWQVFGGQRIVMGALVVVTLGLFAPKIWQVIRTVRKRYLGLAGLSEVINEGGALLYIIATSLWFVTLVETTVSVQYVFLVGWGVLLVRWRPKWLREISTPRIVAQKLISIALIIIGVFLIS